MTALNKYAALRQLATDAHEQGIIKRYRKGIEANKRFVAIATPLAVLALLDELEHYKSREDRVTKLVLDNSTSWDELYKKLEVAEKRIAELEARTVTLPSERFRYGESDYDDGFVNGWNAHGIETKSALRAAGIGVKGE